MPSSGEDAIRAPELSTAAGSGLAQPVPASHPMANQQVSAAYRFKVGGFECTVVSDGPLKLGTFSAALFKGLTQEQIDAFVAANFLDKDNFTVDQNALVLNTGDKLILIDTGMGFRKPYGPRTGHLLANLRAAGIDAASIDVVALSHAHPDHVWGLVGEDGKPHFPNAQIHITQADFEYWTDEAKLSDPALGHYIAAIRDTLSRARAQRKLAVVACADGFAHDGCSSCLQTGKKDAAFHLRAGNRRGVVDGGERCAFNAERSVAFGEREPCAHAFERLADALHRPARKRCVADECEAALLRREQAGDHAHRRAGVAAVEWMVCRSHAAAYAGDFHRIAARPIHFCAQRFHARQCRGAVGAGGEVGKARCAFRECAQHGVAVADGFVAGQTQAAEDVARGADEAFCCCGVQRGSGN